MYEITALSGYDYDQLAETFNSAFSDYILPVNISAAGLQSMLCSRSYVPELSRGITVSGVLAGVIFIGQRERELYVCSMGVVPEQRRRGLAVRLLEAAQNSLVQSDAQRLLLEVITTNDKAVALYHKQGFEIRRELVCLKVARTALASLANQIVEPVALCNIPGDCSDYFDFLPTWQNQYATIKLFPENTIRAAQVRIGGNIGGFAVFNYQSGSILQLAVDKANRRQGIGKALLAYIAKETTCDSVSMVNVEENQPLAVFLQKAGFSEYVRQYELVWGNTIG
ncbi:MAG: GNAT family N-acetyltransferase [Negativicutes bacterium]|jgi:ribosomal protein S18 acetylase RimI-like enzyme